MSIVVTGATGQLGRLVVEDLLRRGTPASQVVATGRATERLADLADRGVEVRRADYADPASLGAAFAGAETVLLVSSSTVGQRLPDHRRAVDAAAAAGVARVAYTSIVNAGTTRMQLAAEHQGTEQHLRESGLAWTLLRNGWYLENYLGQLPVFLEHGAVLGSAGQGRVSAATRADYAEAAAVVLTTEGHAGAAYELGGDTAFTLDELAQQLSGATGREIVYRDLPVDDYTAVLAGAGVPEPMARVLADADAGLARGELFTDSGDLSRLIGRATTPLGDALGAALASAQAR
ncbi:MAG: NAD(P)H dehydrogenase (quinone) 2 [uncultured Quadrisphaera sp.]|uniref:NAD(P)H dehydrogenase (Quinone) 2 n=1 Tax=uncultured Quadrisphaera sp. TaxID=904978 RepID=A0A6J4P0U6_9ACTN|nr:MAG: NAD(P)H dehydrogenase (quinone) 2 [uncultured Quadrisphaera sp.]